MPVVSEVCYFVNNIKVKNRHQNTIFRDNLHTFDATVGTRVMVSGIKCSTYVLSNTCLSLIVVKSNVTGRNFEI